MRENIEPITGTNLANLSMENLEEELKFYNDFSNKSTNHEIRGILKAIELEIAFRSI